MQCTKWMLTLQPAFAGTRQADRHIWPDKARPSQCTRQGCHQRFWIYPLFEQKCSKNVKFYVILCKIFHFYPFFGCFWPKLRHFYPRLKNTDQLKWSVYRPQRQPWIHITFPVFLQKLWPNSQIEGKVTKSCRQHIPCPRVSKACRYV